MGVAAVLSGSRRHGGSGSALKRNMVRTGEAQ